MRSQDILRIFRFWTMGLILSTIAYGVVFTLSCACFFILRRRTDGGNLGRNLYLGLRTYIVVMFLLSTVSVVYEISSLLGAMASSQIRQSWFSGANPSAVCFVLANWGADGFLVSIIMRLWLHRAYTNLGPCANNWIALEMCHFVWRSFGHQSEGHPWSGSFHIAALLRCVQRIFSSPRT